MVSLLALIFLSHSLVTLPFASASAALVGDLHKRDACAGNTASTRSEWCDFSIDNDYTTETPDTGVTREYWFELGEVEIAPDGVSRYAMAINGTVPGPTIFADWG